ncbi:ATP-binding protein [Candidatus Eisenbacteria bacterium]|uniref:ATP-binding protein n=1 Tax=Eiseniibacteriota bacterium TaxID=2212470 RepID=A0ABV6YI31_UNCEI
MYFKRTFDGVLRDWYGRPDRKPLILRGARQTGKSTTVREFGKKQKLCLELNLERREDLNLVRACSSVEDLLAGLKATRNLSDVPEGTLLFLDEIQESPDLIQWLRFFHEDHPEIAVIAAGSLLEVRLQERGFSFPVGRVTFRTLHPLTFLEFLHALGKDVLADQLWEALRGRKAAPLPLHEDALKCMRDYLLVGGMPEAVASWVNVHRPAAVREIHTDLLQAFSEDFQKYRGVRDLSPLEAAFENLKYHVGTRVSYENFAPGRRSGQMKTALGRLEGALLVTRVWPTSDMALPLRSRPKSAPKLLPVDTGLALTTMGATIEDLRFLPLEKLMDGRLAEIFAGLQLLASRPGRSEPLFFWVSESSRNSAEVDYLLPNEGKTVPLEVKSAASGRLRSLHQFLWKAKQTTGLRVHPGQYADQALEVAMSGETLKYRLVSVPIYMTQAVWELLKSVLNTEDDS